MNFHIHIGRAAALLIAVVFTMATVFRPNVQSVFGAEGIAGGYAQSGVQSGAESPPGESSDTSVNVDDTQDGMGNFGDTGNAPDGESDGTSNVGNTSDDGNNEPGDTLDNEPGYANNTPDTDGDTDGGTDADEDGEELVVQAAPNAPGTPGVVSASLFTFGGGDTRFVSVTSVPAAPAATIDFPAERLRNLAPNSAFAINGAAVVSDAVGTVAIADAWFGESVSIRESVGASYSEPQNLDIPARRAAPAIGFTNTTGGAGNGEITGVSTYMQSRQLINNEWAAWAAIAGTSITNLAAGNFGVRYAATDYAFASHTIELTISEGTFTAVPNEHFTVSGMNAAGWANTGVVITAAVGHQVRPGGTALWLHSAERTLDTAAGSVHVYVRNVLTGSVSHPVEVAYRIDSVPPTAQVRYRGGAFRDFSGNTAFSLLFERVVDVDIQADGGLSGVASVEFYRAAQHVHDTSAIPWVSGSGFSVTSNEKFILYTRITDVAGNTAVLYDSGAVVYTPGTVSIGGGQGGNRTIAVNLHGNTIAGLRIGGAPLVLGRDFSVAGSVITIYSGFLQTLGSGSHSVEVAVYPLGVRSEFTGGDVPFGETIGYVSVTVALSVGNNPAPPAATPPGESPYDQPPRDRDPALPPNVRPAEPPAQEPAANVEADGGEGEPAAEPAQEANEAEEEPARPPAPAIAASSGGGNGNEDSGSSGGNGGIMPADNFEPIAAALTPSGSPAAVGTAGGQSFAVALNGIEYTPNSDTYIVEQRGEHYVVVIDGNGRVVSRTRLTQQEVEIFTRPVPSITIAGRTLLLFAPFGVETWSVLNLLVGGIISVLFAIIVTLYAVIRKQREARKVNALVGFVYDSGQRSVVWLAAIIGMGIASGFVFNIFQNTDSIMVALDMWSIVHIIIICAQIMCLAVMRRYDKAHDIRIKREFSEPGSEV
ncbi:MAG: hypothetical protein FWD98_02095 [Defluviitaleaceae bacterium]|nr:hypothetical protein [Defluviitaleaceae bacterium]